MNRFGFWLRTNMFISLLISLCFTISCATLDDAKTAYFRSDYSVKGVESLPQLIKRMKSKQAISIYGLSTIDKLIRCTVLRNQLYVASLKGMCRSKISNEAWLLEQGYQKNDESFFNTCDEVMKSEIGKKFLATQKYYLSKH